MTKIAPAPPSVLASPALPVLAVASRRECEGPGSRRRWLSTRRSCWPRRLLCLETFDFPDRNAPFLRETQTWFWLKAMLYQPPLEFACGLSSSARVVPRGRLFWRIGAVIATVLPFGLLIAYQQNSLGWGFTSRWRRPGSR